MKNYIIIISCLFITSCSVIYSRFSEALFKVATDLLHENEVGEDKEKEEEVIIEIVK